MLEEKWKKYRTVRLLEKCFFSFVEQDKIRLYSVYTHSLMNGAFIGVYLWECFVQ